MGKNVILTAKGCLKSVCNHPFLICILCFLIFLHRWFPGVFSLLVSASPVFVCTGVLLGALLSFGEANVPEREGKNVAVLVKSGEPSVGNVGGIGGCFVVRVNGERQNEVVIREASEVGDNQSVGLGKDGIWEVDGKLGDMRDNKESEWNEAESDGEVMRKRYNALSSEVSKNVQSDYEGSDTDSFDSEKVNVDSHSPPCSPRKKVGNWDDDDDDGERDDTLGSGDDESMSSSPNASMSDITPMLDELHPLLDKDGSQPVQMSLQGSHAASDMSLQSSSSGNESDVDTIDDLDIADNDDDDDDDEAQEQAKLAITWTEEDQRNLQDLGSSEIERNQRLETLMQRRQERKYTSMVPEANFTNLENAGSWVHIAPILTRRKNPFDVPNDSYDSPGLPPLPGSAPSVLLRSRNPFNIPSNLSEEKANTRGGSSQEELTSCKPIEAFFRQHEKFNVGASNLATTRQEKQVAKMRPYFVPELSFHPQLSEMSDSRLSSVPETRSVSSAEDTQDQRLVEDDNPKGVKVAPNMVDVAENRLLGAVKEATKKSLSGDEEPASKGDVLEEEPEMISEHVSHGSPSSKEQSTLEFNNHKLPSPGGGLSSSSRSEASKRFFNETDVSSDNAADDQDISTTQSTVVSSPANDVQHKAIEANISSNVDKLPEPSPLEDKLKSSHKSSDDKNLGHSEEEKHPTVLERESLTRVRVAPSEGQVEVSNAIDKEKAIASHDADNDVYQDAIEKIPTPLVRGSTTTVFYNRAMNDPNSERLEEVQVPNTPVDLDIMRAIPKLNFPNIRELMDARSIVGSPYTPSMTNVPSMPSSASKEAGPHFNMQTILEEVSEPKAVNELFGSDNENENYWRAHPTAFDKYVDSVGESSISNNGGLPNTEKTNSTDVVQSNNNDKLAEVEKEKSGLSIDGEKEKSGLSIDRETGIDEVSSINADKTDNEGKVRDSSKSKGSGSNSDGFPSTEKLDSTNVVQSHNNDRFVDVKKVKSRLSIDGETGIVEVSSIDADKTDDEGKVHNSGKSEDSS